MSTAAAKNVLARDPPHTDVCRRTGQNTCVVPLKMRLKDAESDHDHG